MFEQRTTRDLGAPGAIQMRFFMEKRLDLQGFAAEIYIAREKNSGRRIWLKCSPAGDEAAGLINEASILGALAHPHLPQIVSDHSAEQPHYLTFAWKAETPLTESLAGQLAGPDQIRLAANLVDVVDHLAGREAPVAHGMIDPAHIWLTPEASWIWLVGFEQAAVGATTEQLAADRQAAWAVISMAAFGGDGASAASDRLQQLARAWVADGPAASPDFREMLTSTLIQSVTVDF